MAVGGGVEGSRSNGQRDDLQFSCNFFCRKWSVAPCGLVRNSQRPKHTREDLQPTMSGGQLDM
jgi:hypothetical protein